MPANFDLTSPICTCCSDCYEGQGGDQGLEAERFVRAYDGRATYHHDDWQGGAKGFNMAFGNELAYDSRGGGVSTVYGKDWLPHDLASLEVISGGEVHYKIGPNQIEGFFSPTGDGVFTSGYYVRAKLFYTTGSSSSSSGGGGGYTLLEPDGCVKEFSSTGKLQSFTDAYGNEGTVVSAELKTG